MSIKAQADLASPLSDDDLYRYSRQILLPEIDVLGQQKLLRARVLIVGAGGLGCPVALYLAGSGIGHLTVCDSDSLDLSNLQRQIAYSSSDVGVNKAQLLRQRMLALNPTLEIHALDQRLQAEMLIEEVKKADLVIDASDNFATRFALNDACSAEKKPLISGAAIRLQGQISVFRLDLGRGPCYRCLYNEEAEASRESCNTDGILGPIVGIIGSLQALEAIKILTATGDTLAGRLLIFSAISTAWRTVMLHRDPACQVCAE